MTTATAPSPITLTQLKIPEQELRKVVEWAKKLGVANVEAIQTLLKKLVGDLPRVQQLLNIWNVEVVRDLVDAKEELNLAGRDIGYDWTGQAAVAYKTYLTDMTKSTDQFITISAGLDQISGGFAKGLDDIWNAIVDEYQALNDAILDVFKNVVTAQARIADKVADLAGLVDLQDGAPPVVVARAALAAVGFLSPVLDAFAGLIQAFKEFINKIVDANQSVKSALTGISSAGQRLVVPTPSPKEGEKKYWTPRDQSGDGDSGSGGGDDGSGD